jgi:hypothetical protein
MRRPRHRNPELAMALEDRKLAPRQTENSVILWFVFFSRVQRFAVVAKTSSAFRTFRRTIRKNVFSRLVITAKSRPVLADRGWKGNVAAGSFHLIERPQSFTI